MVAVMDHTYVAESEKIAPTVIDTVSIMFRLGWNPPRLFIRKREGCLDSKVVSFGHSSYEFKRDGDTPLCVMRSGEYHDSLFLNAGFEEVTGVKVADFLKD